MGDPEGFSFTVGVKARALRQKKQKVEKELANGISKLNLSTGVDVLFEVDGLTQVIVAGVETAESKGATVKTADSSKTAKVRWRRFAVEALQADQDRPALCHRISTCLRQPTSHPPRTT